MWENGHELSVTGKTCGKMDPDFSGLDLRAKVSRLPRFSTFMDVHTVPEDFQILVGFNVVSVSVQGLCVSVCVNPWKNAISNVIWFSTRYCYATAT